MIRAALLLGAALLLVGCAAPPLIRASAAGSDADVDALLSGGASLEIAPLSGCGEYPPGAPRAGDETPLICAAINGRESTVKLLLARGANVNARDFLGRSALDYAALNGRIRIVRLLLDKGADTRSADPVAVAEARKPPAAPAEIPAQTSPQDVPQTKPWWEE